MTALETILKALRDARRELAEYDSRGHDAATIIAREGCYIAPQAATQEDLVLESLMGILNNARLLSAIRAMERRSCFTVVG